MYISVGSQLSVSIGNINRSMITTTHLFSRPGLQANEITRSWVRVPSSAWDQTLEMLVGPQEARQRQRRTETDCVPYLSMDRAMLGIILVQGQHFSANKSGRWGSREKSQNEAKNRCLIHPHIPSAQRDAGTECPKRVLKLWMNE